MPARRRREARGRLAKGGNGHLTPPRGLGCLSRPAGADSRMGVTDTAEEQS